MPFQNYNTTKRKELQTAKLQESDITKLNPLAPKRHMVYVGILQV